MTRQPQPLEVAQLKGADRKDPQRYRARKNSPKSDQPIGGIPEHLSKESKACWFEIETYAIKGVLTAADRIVMEIASNLLSKYRADPDSFSAALIGKLMDCLSRLGMTPVDRQKLGTAKPPEGNPFEDF